MQGSPRRVHSSLSRCPNPTSSPCRPLPHIPLPPTSPYLSSDFSVDEAFICSISPSLRFEMDQKDRTIRYLREELRSVGGKMEKAIIEIAFLRSQQTKYKCAIRQLNHTLDQTRRQAGMTSQARNKDSKFKQIVVKGTIPPREREPHKQHHNVEQNSQERLKNLNISYRNSPEAEIMQQRVQTVERQRRELIQKVVSDEKNHYARVYQMQNEIHTLRSQVSDLQKDFGLQVAATSTQIQGLQRREEKLKKEVDSLRDQLYSTESAYESVLRRDTARQKDGRVCTVELAVEEVASQLSSRKDKIAEPAQTIRMLEIQLKNRVDEINLLKNNICRFYENKSLFDNSEVISESESEGLLSKSISDPFIPNFSVQYATNAGLLQQKTGNNGMIENVKSIMREHKLLQDKSKGHTREMSKQKKRVQMDSLMEREETETLRMYATRLEVEIKKLRNEKENQQVTTQERNASVENLEECLSSKTQEQGIRFNEDGQNSSLKEQRRKLLEAEKEIHRLIAEIAGKSQLIEVLEMEIQQIRIASKDYRQTLAKLQLVEATEELTRDKFRQLEGSIESLKNEVQQKQQLLQSAIQRNFELQQDLGEAAARHQKSDYENQEARRLSTQLEVLLQSKRQEIVSLRTAVLHRDNSIREGQSQHRMELQEIQSRGRYELDLVQKQVAAGDRVTKSTINSLQKQLGEKERLFSREVEYLKQSHQDETSALSVQVQRLQAQVAAMKQEYDKIRCRYQVSSAKIKKMRHKFNALINGVKSIEEGLIQELTASMGEIVLEAQGSAATCSGEPDNAKRVQMEEDIDTVEKREFGRSSNGGLAIIVEVSEFSDNVEPPQTALRRTLSTPLKTKYEW